MKTCWRGPLLLLLALLGGLSATLANATPSAMDEPPTSRRSLAFRALVDPPLELNGFIPSRQLEFSIRGDRLVTRAVLDLHYTPSPALLDGLSQLKVYLNEELIEVVGLTTREGQQRRRIPFDARLLRDFNRLRIELVGHYTNVCENPVHSSIWVNLSEASTLELTEQALPLTNDLARLPQPFFEARAPTSLELPIVVPASPSLAVQRAGGIVASWFGSLADWRGQHFPAFTELPPQRHAVVLATNDARPAFLDDYPAVEGPTLEIISHPETPYAKLLLVLGRDAEELLVAARGLALGDVLLRGQSARVETVETVTPRQPYDAPRWVPTDRPVRLAELIEYPGQLQAEGYDIKPLAVDVRMPPDLFVWQDALIDLDLDYRYTPPQSRQGSRLDIRVNDEFLRAFPLEEGENDRLERLKLPVLNEWLGMQGSVAIPALRLGANNQLTFDFAYVNRVGGGSPDDCTSFTRVPHRAAIDPSSTLDLSGFPHYLAMPALETFAEAGFPFSRMADLSQTLVVMPPAPTRHQLTALFDALGRIGAQTGYPGVAVRLTDDWSRAETLDADILAIGSLPASLGGQASVMALEPSARARLSLANRTAKPQRLSATVLPADHRVTVRAHGPLAALVGLASPFFDQRSIVALLTAGDADQRLLNRTLNAAEARAQIHGTVAVIRDGRVDSQTVGERYYVGRLPWTTWLWFHLSRYPGLIVALAGVAVGLAAWLLWLALRRISARRLADDGE